MKILIVGESFSDVYHIGTTNRVSPEAPVPVILVESELRLPGGSANVAQNLAGWGVEVHNVSAPSGIKNRLMVGNVQVARWDEYDRSQPFSQINLNSLPYYTDFDGVIISDYGKGFFDKICLDWMERLTALPFFIDTKASPSKYARFTNATFFPNAKEFSQYKDEYTALPKVVYKRGADGMEFLENGQPTHFEKARHTRPVSVCGAGDTVLAAYCFDYLQYLNFRSALGFASAAAAAAVAGSYTTAPLMPEIEAYLGQEKVLNEA